MDKELWERVNAAFLALEKRQKGSVVKAQNLCKTLRQLGEKQLATQLVRQINKNAAHMPRENW